MNLLGGYRSVQKLRHFLAGIFPGLAAPLGGGDHRRCGQGRRRVVRRPLDRGLRPRLELPAGRRRVRPSRVAFIPAVALFLYFGAAMVGALPKSWWGLLIPMQALPR